MRVEEFINAVAPIGRAKIFHGAQLRDFETYVGCRYVVPRAELFERDVTEYTPFDSDHDDQERMDCAADFFGNLVDQGIFSRNGGGIPNVYGPITLVFYPNALRNSGSNAVTVRRSAIWSSDEAAREVLDGGGIRALYNDKGYASRGEIQVHGGTLRLADLAYVVVNPITINGQALIERVRALLRDFPGRNGFPVPVYVRDFVEDGARVYAQIVEWATSAPLRGGAYDTLPADLQERFERLGGWKFANVPRFAEYLSHGTLSRLRNENGHLAARVAFDAEYEEPYYDDEADFVESIANLDTDQLRDRDEALWQVERAEFHLDQARRSNAYNRQERIEEAWHEYVEAIEWLNQWISETSRRILADRDEMHEQYVGSHDGQLSANLTAWADEFEEIEIPDDDPTAAEHVLLDWRKVREYSESGW